MDFVDAKRAISEHHNNSVHVDGMPHNFDVLG
jgi:hypothetical protein